MPTQEQYFKLPTETIPQYNQRILSLQATAPSNYQNNPLSFDRTASQSAQQVAQSIPTNTPTATDPNQQLNALMDLMRQHQAIMATNAYQGQREQALRAADLPSSLIGASPSQQNQVLGAQASALQPTISGANTAFSDIGNIISMIGRHELLNKQMQQEALQTFHNTIMEGGSTAFANMDPAALADLNKRLGQKPGYAEGVIAGVKKKEERQYALDQERLAMDRTRMAMEQARTDAMLGNSKKIADAIKELDKQPPKANIKQVVKGNILTPDVFSWTNPITGEENTASSFQEASDAYNAALAQRKTMKTQIFSQLGGLLGGQSGLLNTASAQTVETPASYGGVDNGNGTWTMPDGTVVTP